MTSPSSISPSERILLRVVCAIALADGQISSEELDQILSEFSKFFADNEVEAQQIRQELQRSALERVALEELVPQLELEEDRELALKLGYMVIRSSRRNPEEAWINPAEKVAYRRLIELLNLPDETVTKIETLTDAELNQQDDFVHAIAQRVRQFIGR
ncbi:tellurite resistance TerB family protein [Leptodesmis sichuanensis]|uniref:tellurite resistance TerB family protein n=1 Tax=Leptodesmis sichuanensis TaxID=2906798 RepID=UPI001F1F875E|nr:TerB family tellurite resistance protein [Leptodesmis sichuanensis]UIE36522.1 TerB family tellurite resistance protein [Leptodesmis sichuanensis A121]